MLHTLHNNCYYAIGWLHWVWAVQMDEPRVKRNHWQKWLIDITTIQQLLVLCFALTPKQDLDAIILVLDSYHQSKPSKVIIYPFEPWAFAESLQDLKHINSKSKNRHCYSDQWPKIFTKDEDNCYLEDM